MTSPSDLMDMMTRHFAEADALLARFERETRNPTIASFVRPNTEDRLALHGGCSIITDHPFTIMFVSGPKGRPCATLVRGDDGRLGMNFIGRKPVVVPVTPESAAKLWQWGADHLKASKSDMRCEIWSVDAAELYFRLHEAQMLEAAPLLDAELAAVKL